MIKRLHNYPISEDDIRAILRQRALLANRSALPTSSNSSTVPPHLYIAWSDSATCVPFIEVVRRRLIARSVRTVSKQQAIAKANTARIVPFEKPFPRDEAPYQPSIPKDLPRLKTPRK
jgi:hypothetical protein